MKTSLKKGQTVTLITGADKGKSGEIIKMFPRDYKALVKGINVKKKASKADQGKKRWDNLYRKTCPLIKFKISRWKKNKIRKKTCRKKRS